MTKTFLTPCNSGFQGMKIWSLIFNIISLQCNALSPSLFELSHPFKIEGVFLVPQVQVLVYWLYDAFIASILYTTKMGFQFWEQIEDRRSHIKRIWGGGGVRKWFQIHIQSQQSWQLVTCGQRRLSCKSRTPRVSFPRLFFAISWHSRLNLPA